MKDDCGNKAFIVVKREDSEISILCSDDNIHMTVKEAKLLIEELNKAILNK